jgi:methionyl-tRNA formyltransferase
VFNHKRLQLYDARKHSARTFSQVKGRIGAVSAIDEHSLRISAQGGQIEVFKLKFDGGKKVPAPQFCAEAGLSVGTILGGQP